MPSLSFGPPRTKTEAIEHDTQVYSIMSLVIVAILLALELMAFNYIAQKRRDKF